MNAHYWIPPTLEPSLSTAQLSSYDPSGIGSVNPPPVTPLPPDAQATIESNPTLNVIDPHPLPVNQDLDIPRHQQQVVEPLAGPELQTPRYNSH